MSEDKLFSAEQGTSAPEMQAFHDALFDAHGPDIYGSAEDWPLIKKSGHERRMEILDGISIADIETKVAVDFGTGPWGFACVFPKLRKAKSCVSIDVSQRALDLAREKDAKILSKMRYLVSDGEVIPLEDNSVDVFWGGEVIEHVRHPHRFIQEIARVCRDSGLVILSTPNKSAIYYRAALEEYTVGPEHIALMNYEEFQACISLFLSRVTITGYETSLLPTIDDLLASQTDLDLVQQRASAHPATASGLLAWGYVDKLRYESNRKTWQMNEVLWSSPNCVGHEHGERLRLFEKVYGISIDPSHSLKISVQCNCVVLLFWAHDWSGIVSINIDGEEYLMDLFSSAGGFRRVEIDLLKLHEHSIEIIRTGRHRDCAHSDQVIFYKLIAYATSAAGHKI